MSDDIDRKLQELEKRVKELEKLIPPVGFPTGFTLSYSAPLATRSFFPRSYDNLFSEEKDK